MVESTYITFNTEFCTHSNSRHFVFAAPPHIKLPTGRVHLTMLKQIKFVLLVFNVTKLLSNYVATLVKSSYAHPSMRLRKR